MNQCLHCGSMIRPDSQFCDEQCKKDKEADDALFFQGFNAKPDSDFYNRAERLMNKCLINLEMEKKFQ